MSSDWNYDDGEKEEEGKDQKDKREYQDKDSEKKTSQASPRIFVVTTLTPHSLTPSIEQFSKKSNVTPKKEEHRCNILVTLVGYVKQDTLENID